MTRLQGESCHGPGPPPTPVSFSFLSVSSSWNSTRLNCRASCPGAGMPTPPARYSHPASSCQDFLRLPECPSSPVHDRQRPCSPRSRATPGAQVQDAMLTGVKEKPQKNGQGDMEERRGHLKE